MDIKIFIERTFPRGFFLEYVGRHRRLWNHGSFIGKAVVLIGWAGLFATSPLLSKLARRWNLASRWVRWGLQHAEFCRLYPREAPFDHHHLKMLMRLPLEERRKAIQEQFPN